MSAEQIRTFDGHPRLFSGFWAAVLDLKFRNMGNKFDERLIANERHFQGSLVCVEVCELGFLTEPRTEQPCIYIRCIYAVLARTIIYVVYSAFFVGKSPNIRSYTVYLYVLTNPIYTVFLARKSPNTRSFTVYIYGSGEFYSPWCVCAHP